MVGACSGPSGAPPVAPVAPDRCPRTVPPSTGRVVVHLVREGHATRFLHTVVSIENGRSASSRGEVVGVFARSFDVLEAGGACTDSTVHGKTSSCGLLRLLKVSVSAIHCDGSP